MCVERYLQRGHIATHASFYLVFFAALLQQANVCNSCLIFNRYGHFRGGKKKKKTLVHRCVWHSPLAFIHR